eukprot:6004131-Lingulodinium_polyedra.AAC.1
MRRDGRTIGLVGTTFICPGCQGCGKETSHLRISDGLRVRRGLQARVRRPLPRGSQAGRV